MGYKTSLKNTEARIESELRGTTLKVYWYLLKCGSEVPISARKAQRALGFSSPALATYHLDKLEQLGLLEKKHGEYELVREVRVGVLKQFVKVGKTLLPRYLFYAVLFTMLLALYATYLFFFEKTNISSTFALIFGCLGVIISWYETVKAWKERK